MSKNHFPRRRDCRGEHCSPGNLTWQRISGKATHAGNEHGRTKRPYRALFRQSDWNQSFLSKTKIPYCKNSRHRFDVQNNDDCNLLYPARTFRQVGGHKKQRPLRSGVAAVESIKIKPPKKVEAYTKCYAIQKSAVRLNPRKKLDSQFYIAAAACRLAGDTTLRCHLL